mmetsp:Transcript_9729/g.40850  ORF Transcript_9729/g.40850 Transcript_9729/m.40850 type:complete len:462 (+) Transcript_9729:2908-4293(+)
MICFVHFEGSARGSTMRTHDPQVPGGAFGAPNRSAGVIANSSSESSSPPSASIASALLFPPDSPFCPSGPSRDRNGTQLWSASTTATVRKSGCTVSSLGVYLSFKDTASKLSPRRSAARTRSVFPHDATMPSGTSSERKGAPCSSASYDAGASEKRPCRSTQPSQGLEESASIAGAPPCVVVWNRAGGLVPKNRARASPMEPVTTSTSARTNTPFARPALRYTRPASFPVPAVCSMSRDEGAAAKACTPTVCRQSSRASDRTRTVLSNAPTAAKRARSAPSGTLGNVRHATSPLVSIFSISTNAPVWSSSKYTTSPPLSAMSACRAFTEQRVTVLRPGHRHSFTRPSARTCLSPEGWICSSASSPSLDALSVGTSPKKPESLTSSTVSPTRSTSVASVNETTMNATLTSAEVFAPAPLDRLALTVNKPLGLPGRGLTAISVSATPRLSVLRVERDPAPHSA